MSNSFFGLFDANHVFWKSKSKAYLVILLLAIVLYGNTLSHEYCLDDGLVIWENKFTQKGIAGIPDILKYDSFRGFFDQGGKANMVAGGRYRPFTLIIFAIQHQLFGSNPFIGHLFNVLAFALLCMLVYYIVKHLLYHVYTVSKSRQIAFISAIIFTTHPIHTEVVANIKGLDEIFALLFSLISAIAVFHYMDTKKMIVLVFASCTFFIALLSKENAISFLFLIPLSIYLFKDRNISKIIISILPLIIVTAIFLYIRGSILGWSTKISGRMEMMNDPFIKFEAGKYAYFTLQERYATIAYTLFDYLRLLCFPKTLTHDYYPIQIPRQSFSKLLPYVSILMYSLMLFAAINFRNKKPIITLSIAIFLIPLLIISNIFFPVGTNMGERFIFFSSLGFCIALSWLMITYIQSKSVLFFSVLAIVLLTGFKTIDRNAAWKNNFTLFSTDVKTSQQSIKMQNAMGGILMERATSQKDTAQKHATLRKSIPYFNNALKLHPYYVDAKLNLGNTYFMLNDYDNAITIYKQILAFLPEDKDAYKNLGLAYREKGRELGMKYGDSKAALQYLNQAVQMNPKDQETVMLVGIAYGTQNENAMAITYFNKALEINPNNAQAYFNLGIAYKINNEASKSEEAFKKAKSLDPDIYTKNNTPE